MGVHIMPQRDSLGRTIGVSSPFATNKVSEGTLYKRVHGVIKTINANSTEKIEFVVPYALAKFTGADIVGCSIGDSVDFKINDTATNTYSGLDVQTYGANFTLNQFGFNVYMSDGYYSNTSNYDASLYTDMIITCVYTNNGSEAKQIAINCELHEVVNE